MANDPNKAPDAGAGQGGSKPPENPPESKAAPKRETYLFGSAGSYSATTGDKIPGTKDPGQKVLRFGDELKLTAAEFKNLKEKLRAQLVPASQWAAHKKKVLKGNKPMNKG